MAKRRKRPTSDCLGCGTLVSGYNNLSGMCRSCSMIARSSKLAGKAIDPKWLSRGSSTYSTGSTMISNGA